MSPITRALLGLALILSVVPASAGASDGGGGTGGMSVPDDPTIAAAVCEDATAWECERGAKLTLEGESLDDVRQVRFLGGRTSRDDRTVRPRRVETHRVEVQVPPGARSGRIALTGRRGAKTVSPRALRVRARAARSVTPAQQAAPATPPASGEGVFPVAGAHTYGTEINRFGGGRNHKGQDVFAKCGTPLVALYDAKVQHVAFHSNAGNYVVLQGADGESYAYMHMQAPATVRKGDVLKAGSGVGRVGDTGRASGCHLHFEQWTAPGWYEGGSPVDPLPLLKGLDR